MWSAIVTTGVFLAVLVPFSNGLRAVAAAWSATRRVGPDELRRGQSDRSGGAEPLAILMIRILQKSLRDNEQDGQPSDFVFDASRQYVMNEYDHNYARLISMYANLLPPLGFVGTTGGMLMNFMSMHSKDEGLELVSLALALGLASLSSHRTTRPCRLARRLGLYPLRMSPRRPVHHQLLGIDARVDGDGTQPRGDGRHRPHRAAGPMSGR